MSVPPSPAPPGAPQTTREGRRAYDQLIERVRGSEPIRVAVAHPCDRLSLLGALEAWRAGIVTPILVGPPTRLAAVARDCAVDLAHFERVDVPHSHAAAAAAVELAQAGRVDALMKGSLQTDELMAAVLDPASGLHTARLMSHVFMLDIPSYPKPLLLTDTAINIEPTLSEKADIVQNAIELAHALGIAVPRVAVVCAYETVTPKLRSTLDAAALCKMADRGQIVGGVIDGPLAFDTAVSVAAASGKNVASPVAGHADIMLVPNLEAGTLLAKQLEYLAGARGAGIVVGARLPIVLTSRTDTVETHVASCALAHLVVQSRRARLRGIA
jgi:phosphate acetyltransferase